MEAIVLAGGFGTRLQSVVSDRPKPMADINGEPFLKYILEYLKRFDISKVVLSTGYMSEVIEDYFKDSYKGMSIVYSKEETPLGTGGAIKRGLSYCSEDDIIVLNGDTFFDVDIYSLMQRHKSLDADITLSLKKMYDFDRYGTVEVDENFILNFKEKMYVDEGLINGGVYAIKKKRFDIIADKFSIEKDVLEKREKRLGYAISDGYFIDIGIPQDYQKAKEDFKKLDN